MARIRAPHPAVLIALLALLGAPVPGGASAQVPAGVFRRIGAAPERSAANSAPEAARSRAFDVAVDREALRAFRSGRGGRMSLPLFDGGEAVLALRRFEVLAPGAVVTVSGPRGATEFRPDLAFFRGPLEGEPGSLAVLAIAPDEVTGWIERGAGRGRLLLGPVRGDARGAHRLTPDDEVPAPGPFVCPSDDLEPVGAPAPAALPALPRDVQAVTARIVCNVALDCDNEFFAKEGSDTSRAVRYALTMLGTTSSIYEREINVALQASYLNVWAGPDPYSATSTFEALEEVAHYWRANRASVPRTVVQLVSGRSLGGGEAWVGTLCDTYYGYSVIGNLSGNNLYPTGVTTWDVDVMAHELGHNFSAQHTHACWWQDNGYAPTGALLDSCYTPEGSCAPGTPTHLPPDRGTIMSYCYLLGGMTSIRLDFHPACRSVMRYAAEQAACAGAAIVQPPTALAVTPGATLSWTASTSAGVLSNKVYRSVLPEDLAPATVGGTAGATFADRALGTFYYKLRAVRAADSSGFSGEVRATVCAPSAPSSWTVGAYPMGACAGDFDGDGLLDLAATFGGQSVSILRGQGAGGVPDGTFAPAVAVALPAGSNPTGICAVDLDGDGILDLAVACQGAAAVSVLWGHGSGGVGNGTFVPGPSLAVSGGPWVVVDGDFDSDGIADLAAGGPGGIAVLRGQGAGGMSDRTFAPAMTYGSGGVAYGLVAGDFNADGITDLAAAAGLGLGVLLGNGIDGRGDGTFAPVTTTACQSGPDAIVTGDFDANGITDVAIANGSSGTVSVLLGHGIAGVGDGTFAAPASYACGSSPNAVVAGDWDGDGITDLAVSNGGSAGTITVLAGRGNGTFAAAQSFAAGSSVRWLALGDFDGDGVADFAVANNNNSGTISTLLTTCPSAQPMTLRMIEPSASATWIAGTRHDISWSRAPGVRAVDLAVSRDGGARWQSLARAVTDTVFSWSACGPYSSQVRFRVQDPAVPAHVALGDSLVTVLPAALVDAPPAVVPSRLALAVRPNPAREGAEAWFTLPVPGPARLELLDVTGRRVRVIDAGAAAGPRLLDLGGTAVLRPGLYLVRLVQGGRAVTARLVVTR